MEPVARHRALLVRRGASARRRRRAGGCAVRGDVRRRRRRWATPTRSSSARPSSRVLAMDRGRWAEAADHLDLALATIDEHRMHDYAISVLAFAVAARLAVHRGDLTEADRQLTRAMRARPSCTFALPFLAVRGTPAARQGVLRDRRPGDRSPPAAGDRRHPAPPAGPRRARRRGLGVSPSPHVEHPARCRSARSPLTPAELRLLPYLQTHLTIREIGERLFVSRNTVSSEVGSIYRKLGVSSRSDAVQQATTIGLLGG